MSNIFSTFSAIIQLARCTQIIYIVAGFGWLHQLHGYGELAILAILRTNYVCSLLCVCVCVSVYERKGRGYFGFRSSIEPKVVRTNDEDCCSR